MFSDKKQKQFMEPSVSQNRINEGTKLVGDITSTGFFRIDGTIEGTLEKPSKVVLGKSGFIKGKLVCGDADLEGRFEGELHVSGTLTLKSSARIQGQVVVGKLSVEPGAIFNGTCSMQEEGQSKAPENNTVSKGSLFDRQHRLKKTEASETTSA
ncbi:polymer-forming cytoskeletal protein [Flavobacteriaceae bacterium]|jgi:cytoskeletal protein CcmA (bactofilin family)|nr:polymer-forming cytoskeletal protein [Flavobacteriaceae bacterium]